MKLLRKKIGLALSGGAIRGAAHIGVLKTLEQQQIPVDYISGTSIGALVAALYAFGKTPAEIETIASDLDWLDITKFIIPRLGLLSNEEMGELLESILGPARIEQARIPLAIVATDVNTGDKIVFRRGPVAHAVMASTCIPGIFSPVQEDGRLLVDGLLVENVPVSPLQEMGADVILAVDLSNERKYKPADDIIDVVMNSFEIAVDTNTLHQIRAADVVIRPQVSEFSRTDTKQVKQLIARGEDAARAAMPQIAKALRRKRRMNMWSRLRNWLGRKILPAVG